MNLTSVEQEMMRIWDARAELTPEIVVEEATPVASPLHGEFEWDNAVAGHRYRLHQAANLIRSAKLKVTKLEDGSVKDYRIREFVAARHAGLPDKPPGAYVPVRELTGPERQVLLQRMLRELAAVKRRYEGLIEFWDQLDAMMKDHNGEAA